MRITIEDHDDACVDNHEDHDDNNLAPLISNPVDNQASEDGERLKHLQ